MSTEQKRGTGRTTLMLCAVRRYLRHHCAAVIVGMDSAHAKMLRGMYGELFGPGPACSVRFMSLHQWLNTPPDGNKPFIDHAAIEHRVEELLQRRADIDRELAQVRQWGLYEH